MNKKAVFFTFMSIFVIIILVALVSTTQKHRYTEKANSIASRIKTMDAFVNDFESDLDREMLIGGYRALISMSAHIRDIQSYVSDFDSVFSEIFLNGTANGTAMDLMTQNSQGADLTSWTERINQEASLLNLVVALQVNDIWVTQSSPWNVTFNLNVTVNISDSKNLASWVFTKVYLRDFSILGFEDPLYIVGTTDRVTNLINMTPDLDFVDDSTNNTAVLGSHLENSYYANSSSAPSFIMRFTGNLSPSENGIESMVYLEKLSAQDIPLKPRSVIDHIYFGNLTTSDYCSLPDLPTWFRIDEGNAAAYEIDKIIDAGNPPYCP